jgi:purine nucleoside phosphorylase
MSAFAEGTSPMAEISRRVRRVAVPLCLFWLLAIGVAREQAAQTPAPAAREKERVTIGIISEDRNRPNLESEATLEDTFRVDTPLGKSPTIRRLRYKGVPFYVLTRFGERGSGEITSPADESFAGERNVQIWVTFMQLGLEDVLSVNSIGGINPKLNYNDLMIVDDYIDLKPNHPQSILPFFYKKDELSFARLSTRMNPVFCPELRRAMYDQALKVHDAKVYYGGTLVQSRTGRWETPAEVRMMQMLGGDVVGTSDGTWAVYAKQAKIHYAALQYVMNFAEGLRPNDTPTTSPAGFQRIHESSRTIFLETVASLNGFHHNCGEFRTP